MELDRLGGGGLDGKRVRCRLTGGILDLPESAWYICQAAMLQDSLVFFSVGPYAPLFESRLLTEPPTVRWARPSRWGLQAQGTLGIWSFW